MTGTSVKVRKITRSNAMHCCLDVQTELLVKRFQPPTPQASSALPLLALKRQKHKQRVKPKRKVNIAVFQKCSPLWDWEGDGKVWGGSGMKSFRIGRT